MTVMEIEQLELERLALAHQEELAAEAAAMQPLREPTPEAERTVEYKEPPPRPEFDFEGYRAQRRFEKSIVERRRTGASRSQLEVIALRHGVRAALALPAAAQLPMATMPRPRESRVRRVVRRVTRRSARSSGRDGPSDEPDPPIGGGQR